MTLKLRLYFLMAWMISGALTVLLGDDFQQTWPQWRGPDRDGQYQGKQWPDSLEKHQFKLQWSQDLESSYSSPIADQKFLYTTESLGSDTESIMAYDRATGKLTWTTSWKGGMKVPFFARANGSWIRSTPTLHQGKLYVMGMQETLLCVDAADGYVVWKMQIPKKLDTPEPSFGGVSSPLVRDGAVYVQAGGGVLKLSAKSGQLLWSAAISGDAMNSSPFSSLMMHTWNGKPQVVALGRTGLSGIQPENGNLLWKQDVPAFRGMNILTPTLIGDSILTATYGGKAHLFEPSQNEAETWQVRERWNQKFQGYMSSPVVVDGHAYIHGRSGRMVCLDVASGDIRWTSGKSFGKYCSMVANQDKILALSSDGKLRLLAANPQSCDILGEMKVSDQETWAHIGVADQQVFIRSLNQMSVFQWDALQSAEKNPNTGELTAQVTF